MDRKPDIFEKIAYLGIAIATAKMYVDLHSGRIHSSLGPVLSFFIDFALYYLIYRAGRFVWRKWIKVRVGQEDCEKEPGSASQSEHTLIAKAQSQMDLQPINDYVLSYLGPFLQDEEKDHLSRNIQSFASSDNPELFPILDRKINGYGLYEISSASDDFTRGYENYRTAFIGPEGTTNFYNSKEDLFSENSSATHVAFFAPRTVSTYTSEGPKGYIVPTLKAVQTFLSKNGLPMDEDPETKNLDLYSIDQEQNTVLLHLNREPRFYASIGYDRGDYDFNGTTFKLLCRKGEPQQNDGIFANEYQTATGYYVKKWVSRADAYNLSNKSFTTGKHTLPLIRVAELYLDYAEAEAEYTGSLSQTGLRYIDVVRHRAGLPDFAEAWSRAGGTPTGEKLIKAIRQERLSEFVFEGRWYHDIRRWKVADEYIGHTPEGWNLDGSSAADFYKVTPVNEGTFVRSFTTPKNYWFAIPLSQLNINKSLVQNPGYN